MNGKVAEALGFVSDQYIGEAARRKKKKYRLVTAVAAVLALVFLLRTPNIPLVISAKAVSIASDSRKTERPRNVDSPQMEQWRQERQWRENVVAGAVDPIMAFTKSCSQTVLSGTDSTNRLWSPINAYIALGMTAELTGGDTRQEVLRVLGASDLPELRERISGIWEQIYQDNGKEISVLANSLWLDRDVDYYADCMDTLSYHYYASVYQGDLGSKKTNQAITNWLNNQTGGFLKDRTGKVELTPHSMLALVSTIYFQSQWDKQFDKSESREGIFHAPQGDVSRAFMNAKEYKTYYYWTEDYGAVRLSMENGSSMWFILPDEGKTIDDVLNSGDYAAMLTGKLGEENRKWMKVNLSIPKFDVSGGADLKEGLRAMGLTGIFEPLGNDFSPSVNSTIPVYLDSIRQDTRVTIDEEGVTAASYIELNFGAGAAEPPDEVMDFIVDRPFVFAVCTENIPLFVGAVNTP